MTIRRAAFALATASTLAFALTAAPAPVSAQSIALPEPVGMTGDPGAQLVLDGNAAFLHGDLETAAHDYGAALRGRPDFAVARFNLGLVEVHANARTAGIRDMDRGIALAVAHRMSPAYVRRLRALRAAFVAAPQADA